MPSDKELQEKPVAIIHLRDCAKHFELTIQGYRKKFLYPPDSKHPKPKTLRPTTFLLSEFNRWVKEGNL